MPRTFLALRTLRCKQHNHCSQRAVSEEQRQPNGKQLKKEETEVALMFNERESLEEKKKQNKKEKSVLKIKLLKLLPRYKYLRHQWYSRQPIIYIDRYTFYCLFLPFFFFAKNESAFYLIIAFLKRL